MKKFDELYNKIITETSEQRQVFIFDTYQEAREFLNKNYNGHGPIYDINGEMIENCRCISSIHKQMNIPYVQCKQTAEEVKKEFKNSYKKFEDSKIV